MPQIPIMPFVALILLLLPVRLDRIQLTRLAFFLWMTGGVVLTGFGISRLTPPNLHLDSTMFAITLAVCLIIGFAKGRFILAKTSDRNLQRISDLTERRKPIHVYSVRSWIVIALMVVISLSLTWLNAPMFWRGAVNLAVGFALMISSLNYLRGPQKWGAEKHSALPS